jgi:hypothetical protein
MTLLMPAPAVSSLIPKLYTISVLSSLNFRREQRDSSGLKRSDPEIGAFHVPSQVRSLQCGT